MSSPRLSPILTAGLEVMEHAMEHLQIGTEKNMKFAVLHADNAVELILKELVRFKRLRLINAKGQSISYYECVDELLIKGVSIPELPDIDLLHTERNSIYHLGSQPDKKKAEWLVYDVALNFVKRVCRDELNYIIGTFSEKFKLSQDVKQEIELTRSTIVNKYLKDTISALNSNMFETAVLLSYIGIEAMIREYISVKIPHHREFIKTVENQFSKKLQARFLVLRNIRNRVAHGGLEATKQDAKFALNVFREAIDEIGLPLELKCKTCGVQFNSGIVMSRKTFETSILKANKHKCPKGHIHSYDKEDYIVKL